MEKVKDIEHLNSLIGAGKTEYFIALNFGLRSSKDISFAASGEHRYRVYNHIDDTEQILTEEQLFNEGETNIGKAINCGALYAY